MCERIQTPVLHQSHVHTQTDKGLAQVGHEQRRYADFTPHAVPGESPLLHESDDVLHKQVPEGGYQTADDRDQSTVWAMAGMTRGWCGPIDCPAPDGSGRVRALSYAEVRAILARFDGLNPYDRGLVPDLWKVEHRSLERQLFAYVISAKRYALFHLEDGRLGEIVRTGEDADSAAAAEEFVDWSEHGLGQYLDPLPEGVPGRPNRDRTGRRVWVKEAWRWILERKLGGDPALPDWTERYTLSQFSLSSPTIATWFAGRDAAVDPAERMRPGSFGLIAHPDPQLHAAAGGTWPAAVYERDPRRWEHLQWYDRHSDRPIPVCTFGPATSGAAIRRALERGAVPIRTLGDVLRGYELRPEHKSLAPDGSPTTGRTRGLLRRRPLSSTPALTHLAGKEGNKLLERITGVVREAAEYRSDYGTREEQWPLVVAMLERMGRGEAAQRSGFDPATVWRAAQRPSGPARAATRSKLIGVATEYAREELQKLAIVSASDSATVLAQLLRSTAHRAPRLCECGCGRELAPRQRRWATDACRQRALRTRARLCAVRALAKRSHRKDQPAR